MEFKISSFAPIVFLPVRLETRFSDAADGTVALKVRIYPDQIHVDAHDPELTDREVIARTSWKQSSRDLAAWRDLVSLVGANRAAYIASLDDSVDPKNRDGSWAKAPRARLLPDHWRVVVERQDVAAASWSADGKDVKPDLAVGFSPDDPGEISPDAIQLAPDLAWLADFDAAVEAGMAVTVGLPAGTTGPLRVLAYGVRDRDPLEEATCLQKLLDAHHYTDGLAFLAAGTPTNHTSDEAAPWTSAHATADDTFPIERTGGQAPAGSVGAALADALGVPASLFDRVDPGTDRDRDWSGLQDQVRAMHRALWPATLGYFLEQMLDGALLMGESVEQVRRFFIDRVRSRGPLPTLRVGRDPYGVLPIVPLSTWRASVEDGVDEGLVSIFRAIRTVWSGATSTAPRLRPGATDEELTRVLSMAPVSRSFVGRSVIGASYATYLYDFLRHPLDKPWWQAQRARALAGWLAAQLPDRNTRLSRATYDGSHFPIAGAVVQATVDGNELTLNYLTPLLAASLADIRSASELAGGTPLLYRLARHAAMGSFLAAARRDLVKQKPDRVVLEPEMIGLSTDLQPPWTWLDETASTGGALRDVLATKAKTTLDDPAFIDCWQGLEDLSKMPSDRLDALTRETLDLCSHRLDAWLTAVAWQRVQALRKGSPGVQIGGYGFVEDLQRSPRRQPVPPPAGEADGGALYEAQDPGGFVHAPSLAHATTAAILRSGFLAHGGGAQQPFAVDLRSARVRTAREILAAIRAGDSLGQALGRRIEDALLSATAPLWQYVQPLRELTAPAGTPFPDRVTIDGYALARKNRPPASLPWGTQGLPPSGSDDEKAISAILADVETTLDAVGDLLVAESVHQLAQGNPGRASGVLDALALGATPPADLAVLDVPTSGTGLSHRVLALVPADGRATGWTTTPRATGEPALEAWCAAVLGPAASYGAHVRYFDSADHELGTKTFALDTLSIGALDAVRAAKLGELDARVLDIARTAPPPGISDAARIAIDSTPVTGAISFDALVLLGGALAEVLSRARSARAIDLAPKSDADETPVDDATLAALEARSSDSLLADTLGQLGADPHAGLLAAAALGVDGAVPSLDRSVWPRQVDVAVATLTTRQAKLAALPAAASADERLARAIQRLHLLLGDDLAIAVPFDAPASDLATSLADHDALVGDDETAPIAWLSQVASVRAELAALERALVAADTLSPRDPAVDLRVAQLPFASGEPWIGRNVFAGTSPPGARRGFVFHAPLGLELGRPIAGLLIDSWSEAVPAPTQTTGIAFQVEQPTAAPPQAILLAVAPDLTQNTWSDDTVEQVVREALDLAKLRLVDGDLIDAAGHYLPGLYFAINLAGDTASTDFTGGT